MTITYRWEDVAVDEDLRLEVLDYQYESTLERLLKMKGALSLQEDGRILSEDGAAWVYEVHHGATIEFHGIEVRFELAD